MTEIKQQRRQNDKMAWKITRWVLDCFLVILLGASSWSFKLLVDMNVNQKVIASTLNTVVANQAIDRDNIDDLKIWKAETSSNRFTIQDGIKLTEKMTELAEAVARIPKEPTPPSWVIDRLDRMQAQIDKNSTL